MRGKTPGHSSASCSGPRPPIEVGKIGRVPSSPHARSAQKARIPSDRAWFMRMLMFHLTLLDGRPRPFGFR